MTKPKIDFRVDKTDLDSLHLIHRQRAAMALQEGRKLPRQAEVSREIFKRGLKGFAEEAGLVQWLRLFRPIDLDSGERADRLVVESKDIDHVKNAVEAQAKLLGIEFLEGNPDLPMTPPSGDLLALVRPPNMVLTVRGPVKFFGYRIRQRPVQSPRLASEVRRTGRTLTQPAT